LTYFHSGSEETGARPTPHAPPREEAQAIHADGIEQLLLGEVDVALEAQASRTTSLAGGLVHAAGDVVAA